ncbi:G/U mismatch-specific uracil-DNA glycosylase [Actinokineospora spheciospongiae]|nr:G/U mismatch-specific uracil-DNA glycosylase [Actinokineospora spheciospongiae]
MIDFCSHGVVPRPTRDELAAAHDRTIPDVLAPDLDVLFCGINPGLYSGFTGHHFARPGNRFWPALHASGFTPRLLRPAEQEELTSFGLGLTNLVARATARADELSDEELRAGGQRLVEVVRQYRPGMLAVVGITAYRTAFGVPKATIGRQGTTIGDAGVWVLPNPSGLNAHYQLEALAAEFRLLREALR